MAGALENAEVGRRRSRRVTPRSEELRGYVLDVVYGDLQKFREVGPSCERFQP